MAIDDRAQRETDLVLPLGAHAFILDTTKGNVNVYVGPMKQPLSNGQEVPVVMNEAGRFEEVDKLTATKNNITAVKGEYVVLKNPARDGKTPPLGKNSTPDMELLRMGETVNIPGPTFFPPWPMQVAEVVKGHHLKSNQYLLVRVYDEDAAKKNWEQGTIKRATGDAASDENPVLGLDPKTLTIGQQVIIKGTEVSFYIPPTGIEVLKDGGNYVRDALTLERLEYCLLVDESGVKRYVRGPEVVFPLPTETFKLNDDKERKSRAYELNEISGIHIKVIADYEDEFKVSHAEGDELFITGRRNTAGSEEETSIYFPRVEHAILKYDGRTRYHAIAIPPGEARYVLDRLNGKVRLEYGPSMFLPDPRKEVIAKRILSPNECRTYYPGNTRVEQYNNNLRIQNNEAEMIGATAGMPAVRTGHMVTASLGDMSYSSNVMSSRAMDVLNRETKYTPPRNIILDAEFEGAVKIKPWTGYAVQVVNQAGDRRVEIGPKTIMLEFDERLDVLSLSTGTPKQSDKRLETVYLRFSNNAVSDVFEAKTLDLVPIRIHLKYLVRFIEDQKDHWFNIDNYIQNMVDRFRSLVNNHVRTIPVARFYGEAGPILRTLILGESGYAFDENGMQVYEVDVLGVNISDQAVGDSMRSLQTESIKNSLEAQRRQSELELQRATQAALQESQKLIHATKKQQITISTDEQNLEAEKKRAQAESETGLALFIADFEKKKASEQVETTKLTVSANKLIQDQEEAVEVAHAEREIKLLLEQAGADKSRIEAISPQLIAALVAMSQAGTLGVISKHFGELSVIRHQSLGATVEAMFQGTPLEGFLDNLNKLGIGATVKN